MKGFAIGTVLQPEHVSTGKGNEKINFGLLVGKSSTLHDVWRDEKGNNRVYDACAKLKDGDTVIVLFASAVDSKGRLREYINDVRLCPAELRKSLNDIFAVGKGA